MKRGIYLSVLLIFLFTSSAPCFWIWTPQSKRWINPKYAPKDTPEEQLKFALDFFEAKDYKKALAEFEKLTRHYPKAKEAAEAQYYAGLILENTEKPYEAYLAYQKVAEKYPFSERLEEIIERQFKIGEKLMSMDRKKILGIELPMDTYVVEIFQTVIKNAPYGKYAPQAQYKIGLILKSLARFGEAKDEFEKVVLNYPESEWVEAAKFQTAICTKEISLDVTYDQDASQEAKERFEEFTKAHPEAELNKEALAQIEALKDKEAENNFAIAQFYEKQKKFDSAKVYYKYVFTNFPQNKWGIKAFERHQVLEKKND